MANGVFCLLLLVIFAGCNLSALARLSHLPSIQKRELSPSVNRIAFVRHVVDQNLSILMAWNKQTQKNQEYVNVCKPNGHQVRVAYVA